MGATLDDTLAELQQQAQEAQSTPPALRVPPKATAAPTPAAPQPPAKKPGFMDSVVGAAKAFAKNPVGETTEAMKGVNASLIRAPGQLVGGLVDASADTGMFIGDNIDRALVRSGQKPFFNSDGHRVYGASLADTLSLRSTVGQYGNKTINQMSTEGIASMLPVVGQEAAAARLGMAAMGGAAAMSAKPGDVAARAKNALGNSALEGGGEVALQAVGAGVRALKTVIKPATPVEAAADALDRSFATQRTQQARVAQADAEAKGEPVEPQPQEQLPAGTRHTDTPKDPHQALADDANTALEQAGAAERLDPATMKVSPEGKIVVAPETKAAADEAGYGRAFTGETLPAHIPPPQRGPGDLWRMSHEELNSALTEKGMSDDQKLVQALGEDGAKEFKRLDRGRNSMDPHRADAASEEFDAKFGNLTPEQERLVYGIGETDAQVDDLKAVAQAHSDVQPGDDAGWLSYMGAVGARGLDKDALARVRAGTGTSADQASFVRMGRAYQGLREAGVDANDIPQQMADALVNHAGWKPEQAAEIIGSFVDDLKASSAHAASEPGPRSIIFKEQATDGTSRVIGHMGREDLVNFGADVAHLRDNPGEINLDASSDHGQWTMAHLGAPYDAASVLRAVVDSVPPSTKKLTDPELMEQAAAAADAMGQSPEDALAFARQVAGDQQDAPTALKALQTIWTRMGSDLDAHTTGIDWSTAPQNLVDQARQAIHDLQMFSTAMEESKAGAGNNLRVLSLPDADTYLAAARRADRGEPVAPLDPSNPPPLPRTRDELKTWLDQWNALKDTPAGRAAFLKGLRTYPSGSMYLRTAFANFFTGAILSAPKTILLNVVQPAFFGGLRTLERTAGAALGSINPLLSGAERAEYRAVAAQAPIAYVQTIGDIGDAFRGAARAFVENRSQLGGHNPLDFNSHGIPQALIEAAQRDGKSALPYVFGNLLNYFPSAIFRLHGTTNEVALHLGYMGEVRAKAMLEAANEKLSGADAQALVRTRLQEASDELGRATDAASLDSANRTTMVRAPDREFQPGMAAFEKTIQTWRKNVPELRYLLPVFQVPANALGETLRRVPGAGFLMKETVAELSGSLGAFRKAEAYGRMMLGAGFLAAACHMARNGMMTGSGPQDPQDKALWLQTHQPYSFKAGDQWVSYDRMDPVGGVFAMAAGYYDSSVYRDTDKDMTLAAVGGLAQYFKDHAAIQGVSDVLNFGGNPQDQSTFMRRFGGTVSGFVPAFLQTPRSMADPGLNVKRTPWDYIVDRLPGASLSLDPVRNLLGEPVHKPQDTLVENLLPVTMSPINDYKQEPVLDELDRLYSTTGYAPGMLSPAAGSAAHFDMRDVKLENGGSLYNALMKARTTSQIDGRTLKEALTDLIASDEYAAAPDGTGKVSDVSGGPSVGTRGGMIQQVFTQYTQQTKKDVAAESPIARRWMAVAKVKQDANDRLRGTPAGDIVTNPALLSALGIDLSAYEDKVSGQ